MIPEKVILSPTNSYYTIRKGLQILSEVHCRKVEQLQAELKGISILDTHAIDKMDGKKEMLQALISELESEMRRYI
jgi:hypothetical protein